jgi:uncharacterized repeat protein (TIGR02543 family)
MAPASLVTGRAQNLPLNTFTPPTGFSFLGWNIEADGTGTSFADGASVIDLTTTGGTITLYAQWREVYTIAFNANDGTRTMDSVTFFRGTAQDLPVNAFARTGYRFTGWNTQPGGGGTAYNNTQSVTDLALTGQTATLYAQWTTRTGSPVDFLTWNYPNPSRADSVVNNTWPANFFNSPGTTTGTNLQFFYAMTLDTPATLGHNNRNAINIPNNDPGGWFPRAAVAATTPSEPITAQNSAGWVITFSTAGLDDIKFSANQATTAGGPRDFALAYRIGTTGTWIAFGEIQSAEGTPITDQGNSSPSPTFVDISLPEDVNERAVVQLKVYIASAINKGGTALAANNGNHSINNIGDRAR